MPGMAVGNPVPVLRRRRRFLALALLLLGGHLALGIARLPDRVFARRAADIQRYRDAGAAKFLLGNAQLGGADEIVWLQANVRPGDCVLWRGEAQGAMEFVPAMLAPALVIGEHAVVAGERSYRGRPLTRGTLPDGRDGVVVVEGCRDHLRLHVR